MNSVARLRQLAVIFLATTLAFAALYWWRLAESHEQLRRDSLAQAALRASQLSDAVTQQMDALMHAVDFSVRQLRDQYAAGTPTTFEATVRTALDAFPDGSLLQIGVIDADGYLAYSNLGAKGRVYLGDREHYKAHVGSNEDRLFISKPVFGRASKSWSVQFTRPILRQGKFAGVMVVSLSPDYVARTLAKIEMHPSDVLALFYLDGTYMTRVPDAASAYGKSVPTDRPFIGPDAPRHGIVRIVASLDKVRRTLAWDGMQDFPFIMTVSLGEEAFLAPVAKETADNIQRNAIGIGLILALGAGIAWLLLRIAGQQQALTESEALHRTLFDTVSGGIMVVDSNGRITAWNDAMLAIFGVDAEGLQSRRARILDAGGEPLPKEQYPSFRAARGETIEQTLCQVELDNGERRWISFTSRPLLSSADAAFHAAVIAVTDVTQLVAAEESARLAQSVFESAGEGIMVTDSANIIVAVNPAFSRITGYSAAEAIGATPSLLASGQHDPGFYRTMWQRLQADGRWEGEISNRRRDGRAYVEWLKIDVIRDKAGRPHRYVALLSDVTERKRREDEVWRQANFDTLTGLPNRQLLEDRLQRVIAQANRANGEVALLFIDLDRFKPVNDRFGHAAGDDLLRQVARRLENTLRDEDTIARLGGDEFVAVLPDVRGFDGVAKTAEKIVAVLSEPFRVGEHIVEISCCVGVALYPRDAGDPAALIERADQAMYAAKDAGRSTWRTAAKTS